MKNKIVVAMLVVLVTTLLVPAAFAQANCTVRGVIRGEDGKPIPNASVVYSNKETGRKYTIKADKTGNYFSIQVASGNYRVSLLDPDGKPLYPDFFVTAQVSSQERENIVDVDLQKARQQQAGQMTEEQKKQIEKAKAENLKIKGLNEKLVLSKQQQDQGDFEGAVKTMEEALAMDQTHDLVFFRAADAYLAAGKHNSDKAAAKEEFTKAVANYAKAIELKPTVGAYYNNQGEAYVRLGEVDKAVAAYNAAAQNDPAEAGKYYFNLGAIMTNTGKVDEANTAFEKAIAADPNKADAYYQRAINLLGRTCGPSTPQPCVSVDKEGKVTAPPEVEQGLNKYLELAPTGPYAQTAKDTLAMLGAKVQTTYGPQKGKKK